MEHKHKVKKKYQIKKESINSLDLEISWFTF